MAKLQSIRHFPPDVGYRGGPTVRMFTPAALQMRCGKAETIRFAAAMAIIIAVGVNSDGRREVLGMEIGASEAETFWTAFLRKLARRGLRGVKLVVSDSHEGIKAAVSKVLSTTWQRCRVHPRVKPEGMLHAQRPGPCRQATSWPMPASRGRA
jgi:hypothetical protein